MKTIILAAGIGQRLGKRLGNSSENKPKCLLELNGKSLLQRHLEILHYYGIDDIVIVTGFESDMIKSTLSEIGADHVDICFNPDFTRGSILSMISGLGTLEINQDFILMDADVLYDHNILGRLINSDRENVFLLDQNFEMGEEPVKLCVRNGHLIEFRKQLDENLAFDFMGESVGFFKFTSATGKLLGIKANEYINRGEDEAPYEEIIRDLLLAKPEQYSFEDVSGLPWLEIDFPDDVVRAKDIILPKLTDLPQKHK
jgi:choline kinase